MLLTFAAAAVLFVLRTADRDAPFDTERGIDVVQQYLADGRLMEAMVVSKKLARECPRNLRGRLLRVEVIRVQKGDDRAVCELETLQQQWPQSTEIAELLRRLRRPPA